MYCFCFTIPYGFMLAVGGLMGFLSKGSQASLIAGGGSGALLMLIGYMSISKFRAKESIWLYNVASFAVIFTVAYMMGMRYKETQSQMSGAVFVSSALLASYVFARVVSNPKPKNKDS